MAGWFPLFAPPGVFSTLKIGGGGFVTSLDMQSDGTKLARTDTYGGYLLVGGVWQQLVTRNSMPSPDNGIDTIPTNQGGAYELVAAPSNTSHLYILFNGYVFTSTNKGSSWTRSAFVQDLTANTGDGYRTAGKFMAVDPNNENICYVGTPTKLSVTTDGGATWTTVSGVVAPTNTSHGGVEIAFDTTSLHPGNVTQTIYAASYGNGVYVTTNGGGSWTKTTGTPTTCLHLLCDQAGTVWLVDDANANGSGGLNRYLSSTWSNRLVAADGIFAVAVNPADSTKVYAATNASNLYVSTNSGGTFVGPTAITVTAADIPWLSQAALDGQFSIGNLVFDPSQTNVLYNANGIGVFTTTPPMTNTTVTWVSQTAGVENLDVNAVIGIASGKPLVTCWDRPAFLLSPGSYPSAYGGPANSGPLASGWSGDISPDGTTAVVLATLIGTSGFSSTASVSTGTWTAMASQTPVTTNSTFGGSICASSSTHMLWLPTDNGTHANRPWTTTDGGATWTARTVGGSVPTTGPNTGWGQNYYNNIFSAAADKVTLDTYYIYNSVSGAQQGIYISTDGGATWTQTFAGNFGGGFAGALQMKAVPGQAGNLFATPGNQGVGNHPATTHLFKSTDSGHTWGQVANVGEVWCVGFGKNAPGQTYPSIYIVGWANGTADVNFGVHRSIDAGATWQKIGDGFPGGTLKAIYDCYGDMGVYGTVYLATLGNGAYMGTGL
jgi:hypothetical protein